MIVQACLNGARPYGYHPALPLSVEAMVADARACVTAGAGEVHVHPRSETGAESLVAVETLMGPLRQACPGTLIGVSTGAWIENSKQATRACIAGWRQCPDYASVNLNEEDAPAVMTLLRKKGVGIEAGLASVADAERFVALPECHEVLRVLVEVDEQDIAEAETALAGIEQILQAAGMTRPLLLHGFDDTVWHFVRLAKAKGFSTRVGLEDGKLRTNGLVATDNAELVADAVALFKSVP